MTWGFLSIAVVIAIITSISASVVIFLMVLNRRVVPDVLLFFAVAALGSLAYLFTSRDLSQPEALLDLAAETWAGRLANMFCLGVCLVALVRTAIHGVVSRAGVIIVLATLQYYFVCFLMPVSFDRWFVFDHKFLYPLAALAIVTMPYSGTLRPLAVNFGRAATLPALVSLVMLAVNYDAAVLSSYKSLLPFFPGRLYGATPHPNVLGAVSAFAIILLTTYPPERRAERIALILINVTALLLCQSKTSWATLLVALFIVHVPSIGRFRGRIPAFVYVILFASLAAAPALLTLLNRDAYSFWAGNQTIRDISTLTGRTDIWQATLFLVKQHLVTGPGQATYVVYMQSLFPNLVPNPHNLYLATLVQAGVVGLASFGIFMLALIAVASSLRGRERLFAFAIIALICLRGMSESFTFQLAFNAPVFWTLLMYMRLLAVAPREQEAGDIALVPPVALRAA